MKYENHNHAWVEWLDLSKADFGKGKRMIVKRGAIQCEMPAHRVGKRSAIG